MYMAYEFESQINAVYAERNRLVAALSKLYPAHLAKDVDQEPEWSNVVCVHLPTGQVTWHVPESELPRWFSHLSMEMGHYDGHTTEEKYERLEGLSATR